MEPKIGTLKVDINIQSPNYRHALVQFNNSSLTLQGLKPTLPIKYHPNGPTDIWSNKQMVQQIFGLIV